MRASYRTRPQAARHIAQRFRPLWPSRDTILNAPGFLGPALRTTATAVGAERLAAREADRLPAIETAVVSAAAADMNVRTSSALDGCRGPGARPRRRAAATARQHLLTHGVLALLVGAP
jgi:hypothetical protein